MHVFLLTLLLLSILAEKKIAERATTVLKVLSRSGILKSRKVSTADVSPLPFT